MRALQLLRWPHLEFAATPMAGLALVATAAFLPINWVLSEHLITSGFLRGATYEVAFLAAVTGLAIGTALLGKRETLLQELVPAQRPAAVFGVLLGFGAVFVAAALIGSRVTPAPLPSSGLLAAVGLTLLHAAALGTLLFEVRLGAGVRVLALLACAWWVPAVLADPGTGGEALGSRLRWILDTARYLEGPGDSATTAGATSGAFAADMAPAATLLLLAQSLALRGRARS